MDPSVNKVHPLFEAFFWFQPSRQHENAPFLPKVIWHSPENVSHVTKEHAEIPYFCFPDLNRLQLEKAQESASEFFVFTLQSASGDRLYGFCYRNLFRGMARRFDVGRRIRHCLCIISHYPYVAFFKSLLMHIYGVALLERFLGQCKTYALGLLKSLSDMAANNLPNLPIPEPGLFSEQALSGADKEVLRNNNALLTPSVTWSLPNQQINQTFQRDVTLLPLLDILGSADKFFKVFSAVLCERRILFVGEDLHQLSSVVLSVAAMIHPFSWNHTLITVLPEKLLSMIATAQSYLIGLKKSWLGMVNKANLEGVVLVDLEVGEVYTYGGGYPIKDLVGDAGNAFKQASEGLDRMRQGLSSFLGSKSSASSSSSNGGSGDSSSETGQRDIMAMILLDMRNIFSSKPGASTITSVLLRGSKTVAESKAQWSLDSEKSLRDSLAVFFVYLFGDLDDFVITQPSGKSSTAPAVSASQSAKIHNEVRNHFNLRGFLERKQSQGISKLLFDFLMEFLHSQLFEDFCKSRLQRILSTSTRTAGVGQSAAHRMSRASSAASVMTSTSESEDLFSVASQELWQRNLPRSAASVKQTIAALSASSATTDESGAATSRVYGEQFHLITWQLTQGNSSAGSSGEGVDFFTSSTSGLEVNDLIRSLGLFNAVDRTIQDSFSLRTLRRIFSTLHYRLQVCRATGCKGGAGWAGCKALLLLHSLLLSGPLCTIACALDLLPVLRGLTRVAPPRNNNSVVGSAADFLSGQFVDLRALSTTVVELIVDHKKLLVQRLHTAIFTLNQSSGAGGASAAGGKLIRQSTIRSRTSTSTSSAFSSPATSTTAATALQLQSDGSRRLPSLQDLHGSLAIPGLPPPAVLRCSEIVASRAEVEDGLDDGEEALTAITVAIGDVSTGKVTPPPRPQRTTPSSSSVTSTSPAPPPEVDLLDLNGTLLDDSAKYRALNKDTGEVLDLRAFEDRNKPLPFPYTIPPTLRPPPRDSAVGNRRKGAGGISPVGENSTGGAARAGDFLDLLAPTSPHETKPQGNSPVGGNSSSSAITTPFLLTPALAAPVQTMPSPRISSTSQPMPAAMLPPPIPAAPQFILTQRPAGLAQAPPDPFKGLVDFTK
eukprot:gene3608-3952_t